MEEESKVMIRVEHLNKTYEVDKQPVEVLRDVSLQIKEG